MGELERGYLDGQKETPIKEPEEIQSRESFNAEKVEMALKNYGKLHQPEPTIIYALESYRPVVQGEKIKIWVDNQLQLEKLETIKPHMYSYLAKTLNHGGIILDFQLFDATQTQEKKKLFTASEKFEYFIELNPAIAELKDVFGLELE
jgi:hypothetical protein